MSCCKKPKFKLETSEKLTKIDKSKFASGNKYDTQEDYQNYIIFCENCGHLERKGQI